MGKGMVTPKEFLEWASNPDNFEAFEDFYYDFDLAIQIDDAEADDYFGTEGFNKRLA